MQSHEQFAQGNYEVSLVKSSLSNEVKHLKLQNEHMMSCWSKLDGRIEQESGEHLQLEIDMWTNIESLNESHEKRLSKIVSNLRCTGAKIKMPRDVFRKVSENSNWVLQYH